MSNPVESEGQGRGSTFTVKLPLAKTARKATTGAVLSELDAQSHGAHYSNALDGMRVLVVDDERDSRDLLSAILTVVAPGKVLDFRYTSPSLASPSLSSGQLLPLAGALSQHNASLLSQWFVA